MSEGTRLRCAICSFFASADQVNPREDEFGTYYVHNAPCDGFRRPDKPRKPKCPKCGHGKVNGHGGRYCIATVEYYFDNSHEGEWCGCTYVVPTASEMKATAGVKG